MKITLYGGPYHGRKATLKPRVGYIKVGNNKGHYARVKGGLPSHFYWYDCEPPIAIGSKPIKELQDAVSLED